MEPSSEEPEAGSEATSVASNVDAVAGANAAEPLVDDAALLLAPSISDSDDDDGGPPFLLIAAALAVLALLGGIALAVYTMVDRDPPLVDIREWDQA